MNVLGRTADGGAIVKVHGNDLGETARPGHHVVLKEVDSTLVDGALYLFATGRFRMYRRVYWTGPDTVKLEPEDGSEIGTIRLQWRSNGKRTRAIPSGGQERYTPASLPAAVRR